MEKKLSTFFICVLVLVTGFALLLSLFMLYGILMKKQDQSVETEVAAANIVLEETSDFGQDYIDKIIFLGESTTYGLQRYGVLSGGTNTKQIWTGATTKNGKVISSGTLSLSPHIDQTKIFYPDTESAISISDAVKKSSPQYLIITLGLNNGASYYSENEFKNCYRILLDSILAVNSETRIILQSLFPVSKNCGIKAYYPERIQTCNKWIYDIAEEYNLKYLNTYEALANEQGYLKDEYDNGGDGIHLNATGLVAVIDYIRYHGYS